MSTEAAITRPRTFNLLKLIELHETAVVASVLVIALILKLVIWGVAVSQGGDSFVGGDTPNYTMPAEAVLALGEYAPSVDQPGTAETLRTPGYPLFIAAIYAMLGHSLQNIALSQIVVNSLTCLLVYLTARTLSGKPIALFSLILFAFDVVSLAWTFIVLTETLFAFFIAGLMLCGVLFIQSTKLRWAALAGIALALSVIVRPLSYYLVFALIPAALVYGWRQGWSIKRHAAVAVLLIIPFLLVVKGWEYRNYQRTGVALLSRIEGINFLFYRGAQIVAYRDGLSREDAREQIRAEIGYYEPTDKSPEELAEEWKRMGIDLGIKYPVLYARSMVGGLLYMLFAPGNEYLSTHLGYDPYEIGNPLSSFARRNIDEILNKWVLTYPVALVIFGYAVLELLVIWSGILLWAYQTMRTRTISAGLLFIGLIASYIILISAGPEAYARFRVALAPALVIFAVIGWYGLIKQRIDRRAAEPAHLVDGSIQAS